MIASAALQPLTTSGTPSLSALENGEKEPGSSVLLAIGNEFGRPVDWLLTGQT
jgi:transcriptional regulator with XRE-family HTH domain